MLHGLRDMKGSRTAVTTYINQAILLSKQFKKRDLVQQLEQLLKDVSHTENHQPIDGSTAKSLHEQAELMK